MSNTKEKQFSVKLSYDELLLIDGKCNEEAQKIIDNAKVEHGFGLDSICNEILAQSMKSSQLTSRLTKKGHNGSYIQNCANCDLKDVQKCTNSNCSSMMLNKLGELEDKIEELEKTQIPQCKNCSQKEWVGDYALDWCEKARKVVDDNTYCHCPQYFKCKGE